MADELRERGGDVVRADEAQSADGDGRVLQQRLRSVLSVDDLNQLNQDVRNVRLHLVAFGIHWRAVRDEEEEREDKGEGG